MMDVIVLHRLCVCLCGFTQGTLYTTTTVYGVLVHHVRVGDMSPESVCVCVHPSHSPGQTDRHTDLNFDMEVKWNYIYVKSVGKDHRSEVKVTRLKKHFMVVSIGFLLTVHKKMC